MAGVAIFTFNASFVGDAIAEVPRCRPVTLAAQFALPEFVIAQVTVIFSPGRAERALNVTFSGARFGRGNSLTTTRGPDRAASSSRELWFKLLVTTSSATTQR